MRLACSSTQARSAGRDTRDGLADAHDAGDVSAGTRAITPGTASNAAHLRPPPVEAAIVASFACSIDVVSYRYCGSLRIG